jgi:hypothetical protein
MLHVHDHNALVKNNFVVDRHSDDVAPGSYKAKLVAGEKTDCGFNLSWQILGGRFSGRTIPQHIRSRPIEAPLTSETVPARVEEICAVTDFDQHGDAEITVDRINGQAVVTGFFIPTAARVVQ